MSACQAVAPVSASAASSSTAAASPGSIRNFEIHDLPMVARLLVAHHVDPCSVSCAIAGASHTPFPRCHLLVLDIHGVVRALAYVVIDRVINALHGHLQLLIVDPGLGAAHHRAIEDRLSGVAVALCEAYGCADVDIAASHHEDSATYPIPRYAVG